MEEVEEKKGKGKLDGDQLCISFRWDQQFAEQTNRGRNGREGAEKRGEGRSGENKVEQLKTNGKD